MALSPTLVDREQNKFFETPDGNTAVRVGQFGAFSAPTGTDAVTVEYPNNTTEIFKFRSGGVSGTILMTLTVTYTNSSKADVSSVVKT